MRKQSGFTLLEILVSLAILTISLTAILSVSSTRADSLIEIRNKSRALLIANSILERHYLEQIQVGVYDGVESLNSQNWYWQLKVSPTNNPHIYRLDVDVSRDNDLSYSDSKLVGFKWH